MIITYKGDNMLLSMHRQLGRNPNSRLKIYLSFPSRMVTSDLVRTGSLAVWSNETEPAIGNLSWSRLYETLQS